MDLQKAPYACHVFVCVNERTDGRTACGGRGNFDVFSALKRESKARGWAGKVRVSRALCFGLCDAGPNVMIYPQGAWMSHVSVEDVPLIVSTIAKLVEEPNQAAPS